MAAMAEQILELRKQQGKLSERLRTVEADFATHTAVCAENGRHIRSDLKEIKTTMAASNDTITDLKTSFAATASMATTEKQRDKFWGTLLLGAVALMSSATTIVVLWRTLGT